MDKKFKLLCIIDMQNDFTDGKPYTARVQKLMGTYTKKGWF